MVEYIERTEDLMLAMNAGVMGPWCSLSDGMLVISPDAFCSYGRRKEDTDD